MAWARISTCIFEQQAPGNSRLLVLEKVNNTAARYQPGFLISYRLATVHLKAYCKSTRGNTPCYVHDNCASKRSYSHANNGAIPRKVIITQRHPVRASQFIDWPVLREEIEAAALLSRLIWLCETRPVSADNSRKKDIFPDGESLFPAVGAAGLIKSVVKSQPKAEPVPGIVRRACVLHPLFHRK